MPKELKELLGEDLRACLERQGVPELLDKIADETVATDPAGDPRPHGEVGHPALAMEDMADYAQSEAAREEEADAAEPALAAVRPSAADRRVARGDEQRALTRCDRTAQGRRSRRSSSRRSRAPSRARSSARSSAPCPRSSSALRIAPSTGAAAAAAISEPAAAAESSPRAAPRSPSARDAWRR